MAHGYFLIYLLHLSSPRGIIREGKGGVAFVESVGGGGGKGGGREGGEEGRGGERRGREQRQYTRRPSPDLSPEVGTLLRPLIRHVFSFAKTSNPVMVAALQN